MGEDLGYLRFIAGMMLVLLVLGAGISIMCSLASTFQDTLTELNEMSPDYEETVDVAVNVTPTPQVIVVTPEPIVVTPEPIVVTPAPVVDVDVDVDYTKNDYEAENIDYSVAIIVIAVLLFVAWLINKGLHVAKEIMKNMNKVEETFEDVQSNDFVE